MLENARPVVSEGYELASGQVIEGLGPDDVLEAVRIWHAYAPKLLDPGCPSVDELDAMARAISAAQASRDGREAEEREHEAHSALSARENATLLQVHDRVRGLA